ncbi:MAG: RecX family transcriptional regulator [Chloroflexi bacterium]|nr:RecX family transcriptional regulator [Chloroflexota bacterium]MBM3154584.1 RecX family transcriptional regulator [Chloroflexota bacterium]MBM3173637.1 RecX family transcriptional regulator [Chloroflexota bacterium]MBM3175993.1 RecX family transcriptional regulator [Chloroflexota bacterium]MBM4449792.1 RecX family transcriptional regulator [Chloroflexota bacterium]
MGMVTTLEGTRQGRVKVFIDGFFSFVINKQDAVRHGLKVGQALSSDEIAELKHSAELQDCIDAALRFLRYRPRSEVEVRVRLRRRGFVSDIADEAVVELKRRKLVDDEVFAQFWTEDRLSFNPKSRQMIKLELRQKGVASHIAEGATADLDDEANAYEVVAKRAQRMRSLDYEEFCRRLSGYLGRRGFSYEVIGKVVKRLWQESHSHSS